MLNFLLLKLWLVPHGVNFKISSDKLHDVHEGHILSAMLYMLWVLLHLCVCTAACLMHPDFMCKVHRMLHTPV